ncbi:S-layer homology domain-containing protein [Sporosarcina oncorhynchi]|uniref:S-layer homology domain-containing protein n=1 Tax=Sporosarcina oncorhynchi TaxID=3056444 RepID=A0ABZ0L6V6_9BACL|nr:NlpC/P60 family protein [Sporosarcina sp. T2O-4]WOV88238.1 S-layer homology domain-containing protein [Sporosarcina sp. T2O-4]
MPKKIISLFIAMVCLFIVFNSASAASLFKDVDETHAAKNELAYLVKQGILTADPEAVFGVGESITRLEASEMIVKALGLEVEEDFEMTFTDVEVDHPGYAIIQAIVNANIMGGNSEGMFMPDDHLTRGQMAGILVKAFQLEGTTTYQFRDVNESYWASDAVKTFYVNGVTTGYEDNTYRPGASLTKAHFSTFLARILNPEFKRSVACYEPDNTLRYAIRVPVTNVWASPNKIRPIDAISVLPNPDMNKWSKSMTVAQKNWLVGRTDTQAIYGDEVEVLKTSGNWMYIAVKEQVKTGNPKGYQGWVPKSHVKAYYANYENCAIAIVESKITTLYNEPKLHEKYKFTNISYSTILKVTNDQGDWLQVQTATDGAKYVRKKDVKMFDDYKSVPKPKQADIVNAAKQYLGLPYLWAGVSSYGFDCSGLMYAVYKNHGIIIPRDSFVQATHGTAVKRKDLQPGDLMFFGYKGGKGKVYHVSMYIGDGKMIHAPSSSRSVEIISIDLGIYKTNYAGARRYLK